MWREMNSRPYWKHLLVCTELIWSLVNIRIPFSSLKKGNGFLQEKIEMSILNNFNAQLNSICITIICFLPILSILPNDFCIYMETVMFLPEPLQNITVLRIKYIMHIYRTFKCSRAHCLIRLYTNILRHVSIIHNLHQ